MSDSDKANEPKPVRQGRSDAEELAYRLRQQSVLAEFGSCAIAAENLDDLLSSAANLCADGMRARFCKVLEYLPERDCFFVRAGVGWKLGYVGSTMAGADKESPTGFAFHTGKPVISNHLENEERFRTPPIMAEHGVRRAVNVLIEDGDGRRWGILEADSPDEGKFDDMDLTFMQGISHLLGVAIDREERTANLRQSEQQFRALADSLPHLVWICDEYGSMSWFNRRWYEYTGISPEKALGFGWTCAEEIGINQPTVDEFMSALKKGEPWELTFQMRGADGKSRWFLTRAQPVRDENNRIVRWFGTNTDITERRAAEELQRTLTREASHRVKNSLAMVSSLLNLQAATLRDDARQALAEAASRVYTMAAVHDQLWRQASAREVELAPFLADLCAAIAATSERRNTVCDVEPVVVSADLAAPIGLLVNELVTNAYKYAYPQGEEGDIRIEGAHTSNGRYRIIVSDKGRGLPENFDLATPGTRLGMRIVRTLARQLDADLIAENARPGARFTLLFQIKDNIEAPVED